jgi:hypothetical protein
MIKLTQDDHVSLQKVRKLTLVRESKLRKFTLVRDNYSDLCA